MVGVFAQGKMASSNWCRNNDETCCRQEIGSDERSSPGQKQLRARPQCVDHQVRELVGYQLCFSLTNEIIDLTITREEELVRRVEEDNILQWREEVRRCCLFEKYLTLAAVAVSTDAFDCLNSLGNNIPYNPFPGLVILPEESVIGRAGDNWIQCASYQILLIK